MTIDWSLPYSSQREGVLGGAAVAASQPLAAQAGLEMLRRGGTAADAAIATAITLTVVEPTANGIGGDAFAMAWDGETLHGLNASGRSPELLTSDAAGRLPSNGWIPVTVPGAVSGWVALHGRLGRLPFADLFGPAIRYAERGFPVSRQTAEAWARAAVRFKDMPGWVSAFPVPSPGDMFRAPDMAATLAEIAESGGESFYRGHLADAVDSAARRDGGLLRRSDLESHTVEWVEPIGTTFGRGVLHELPPNGQGIAALIAAAILQELGVDGGGDEVPVLHMQIEYMKRAFADAHQLVADPEYMKCEVGDMLAADRIELHAKDIGRSASIIDGCVLPRYSSTVYLAAGDEEGGMVSFIQSNFEGFGSGIVVEGTGIALQNRGRGFTLEEGHPNEVGPGKRPFHTIIPAFVTDERGAVGAFGVMGGPMQPQGHLQVGYRMLVGAQNPQAAIDAPRWRLLGGNRLAVEPGWPGEVYEGLRKMGHDLEIADARTVAFGGGQAIFRLSEGYFGASDPRRDGQAVAM